MVIVRRHVILLVYVPTAHGILFNGENCYDANFTLWNEEFMYSWLILVKTFSFKHTHTLTHTQVWPAPLRDPQEMVVV